MQTISGQEEVTRMSTAILTEPITLWFTETDHVEIPDGSVVYIDLSDVNEDGIVAQFGTTFFRIRTTEYVLMN